MFTNLPREMSLEKHILGEGDGGGEKEQNKVGHNVPVYATAVVTPISKDLLIRSGKNTGVSAPWAPPGVDMNCQIFSHGN